MPCHLPGDDQQGTAEEGAGEGGLDGARLHLNFLLCLGAVRLLVAYTGAHGYHGAPAVNGMEEVPRLLGDLTRVCPCPRESGHT